MNRTFLAQIQTWDAHLIELQNPAGDSLGKVPALSALEVIFNNILIIAATTAGLTCLIMLFVGGFKYLTAGGDQKATAAAKATITWAIVGLLVLIGSWFLLRFVATLTGSTTTPSEILQFTIPKPPSPPSPH